MSTAPQSAPRLSESLPGLLLGIILAIVWIASMSAADVNACTITPFLWVLMGVLFITVFCILKGYKTIQLPPLVWFSLLAGGYYLVRAYTGFSLTDNWLDIGLILCAFVFYLAGVFTGQQQSTRGFAIVLAAAVLLNILYFFIMQNSDVSLHWLGRTNTSQLGPNTRNTTLFVYKNFAGLFLSLSGSLLIWRAIWIHERKTGDWFSILIGIAGIVISFYCSTRTPWFIMPLMLAGGWILWFTLRLFTHNKPGWLIICGGILIFVTGVIAIYDFIFGNTVAAAIVNIDSHLRYLMWENVNNSAIDAPLWGYGPAGSVWTIVAPYNEWYLPNFAHNEYIQLWADYGLIGLALAAAILILHIVNGFLCLASDGVSHSRRIRASLALLCLAGLGGSAIADYTWHNHGLIIMTAFACGTLASPFPKRPSGLFTRRNWAPGHAPSLRPLKAEGLCGRVIISALALTLATAMGKLSNTLAPTWMKEWQFDSMVSQHAPADELRKLLADTITTYPHPRIADYYMALAPEVQPDWIAYEKLTRTVLAANPRQLFMVTLLTQILGKQERYREAEEVFRQYYPGDGPDNTRLSCWATFYAANLQKWAQQELNNNNNLGQALSMHNYAGHIARKYGYIPGAAYRGGIKTWTQGGTPEQKAFQRACRSDLALLRAINPPQDHSWKLPLSPGGKPALYQRLQPAQQ
ncbi:MAG: O-antigen ligase family protein [Akkermansia sp.]|nr:O-antigen ligase family protein [Akkermansia sp.]